jgi:cytochrome c
MQDRFNTAAGWVLFAGIVGLGASIASGMYYHGGKPEHVESGGYPIEDLDAGAGGGESAVDLGTILAAADLATGEQQAQARCGTCHTFNQGGANGTGPNLYGVMGLPIGKHAAGFGYSSALAGKGGTWTFEAMNEWLISPRAFASGTTMSFAGLKDDASRASIIMYLNSLGSNLTPPAPQAAEAPAAEGAEGAAPVEGEPAGEAEAAGATGADQPVASENAATANE